MPPFEVIAISMCSTLLILSRYVLEPLAYYQLISYLQCFMLQNINTNFSLFIERMDECSNRDISCDSLRTVDKAN